jgi:acyl-CoA reductase-like NAD-dependent aldehyde dehydrogenase
MIRVVNPYTKETLAELPFATPCEIEHAVGLSRKAYLQWRRSPSHARAKLLLDIAARIAERFDELSELIRDESGKPISYAKAELKRTIEVFQWAAGESQRFAGELLRMDVVPSGRKGFGIHTRFPRGVVLGITPYNWPMLLVAHKVAPALACGCSIVIKPSPFTPLSALRLAQIVRECGAIDGLIQTVLADDKASAFLTQAAEIAMVSFTGSARVGKLVRAQAADKPVVLELGGNAWSAVMDDCDPGLFLEIARRIAGAGYGYAGQGCISVQNVAVARKHRDSFIATLADATRMTPYGDTRDPDVISGPVINAAAADRIRSELNVASNACQIVQSHERRDGALGVENSLVIPPSLVIMQSIPSRESIVQEEIFGPVVTVMDFDDIDQLAEQINSSRYGLQTGVFTNNFKAISRLYEDLNVGGLVVNDVPTARYDHQPYGGPKDSGQGREGVKYAMDDMTESKFLALSAELPG